MTTFGEWRQTDLSSLQRDTDVAIRSVLVEPHLYPFLQLLPAIGYNGPTRKESIQVLGPTYAFKHLADSQGSMAWLRFRIEGDQYQLDASPGFDFAQAANAGGCSLRLASLKAQTPSRTEQFLESQSWIDQVDIPIAVDRPYHGDASAYPIDPSGELYTHAATVLYAWPDGMPYCVRVFYASVCNKVLFIYQW